MKYEKLISFLLGPTLIWLPALFFNLLSLLTVYFFLKRRLLKNPARLFKSLALSAIIFHFSYAFILTAGQYYLWSQNKFTELLIDLPGYFLFYSFNRFWLTAFLSVVLGVIFYWFLKLLKKYRERFFKEGESEIGFLAALIVGWPKFVVFLPLVFVFILIMAIFRRLCFKEFYTTLGWPFILAVFTVLIFGDQLIKILNLEVLKI